MKERVVEIVAAYVGRNKLSVDQLTGLIANVGEALSGLGRAPVAAPAAITPAVPIRRSVGADWIACLECGRKGQMLKRHLSTSHHLTVDEYRIRWGLGPDYPMVARNYAARRSELAKSLGLGHRRTRG